MEAAREISDNCTSSTCNVRRASTNSLNDECFGPATARPAPSWPPEHQHDLYVGRLEHLHHPETYRHGFSTVGGGLGAVLHFEGGRAF